jgi:gluconokinase
MIIVIMGVSGSGKTTVGRELAAALHWDFSDADEFHSPANVEKMKSGVPLTDEDREPWLRSIRDAIERWKRDEPGHVLACSALKKRYRELLGRNDPDVRFVYLHGGFELISERLKSRKGHFFNPALLRSQFEALEDPEDALVVDVSKEPQEIISAILVAIQQVRSKKEELRKKEPQGTTSRKEELKKEELRKKG